MIQRYFDSAARYSAMACGAGFVAAGDIPQAVHYNRAKDPAATALVRRFAEPLRNRRSAAPGAAATDQTASDAMDSLDELNQRLLRFARERDWEQFHSPKNLSMALAGEAGELLEHFQWLTEAQSYELSPEKRAEVEFELADILAYLIRLAQRLDIDLIDALTRKIAVNERRYPAHRVRGDARRASEYGAEGTKD